jgi:hypothetical protein
MSSKVNVFKTSNVVAIERPGVSVVTQKKQAEAAGTSSTKDQDTNTIVRFRNSKGQEIGRIIDAEAK